jgi:DNA-binding NarL/FixJ family response regulator
VRLTCLIVDDSSLFLDGAVDLLGREGVEVVGVARGGEEAMRLVRELRPDVTLVDVDLGDEDGFEVVEQLAALDGATPNVILISTHAADDLGPLIRTSPALGFVSKARLSADAIRELLERVA